MPLAPVNGSVIGQDFTLGSRVEFQCNPGFRLVGPTAAAITCLESGRWSTMEAQPRCVCKCVCVYCVCVCERERERERDCNGHNWLRASRVSGKGACVTHFRPRRGNRRGGGPLSRGHR